MKVTLHVPPGETIKQLMADLRALEPGLQPRTVSGRVGVLVDADLAYRYLAQRIGPTPVELSERMRAARAWAQANPVIPVAPTPTPEPEPEDQAPVTPATAPEAPETPEQAAPAPKATPAKKATSKTKKSEE